MYKPWCPMQALLAVGGILGSILGGVLSNRVGRRAVLLVSGLVDLIGWLLIFIAQYTETSSAFKALLLLGRFWTGVGSGALGSIVPVRYIYTIPFLVIIQLMHN
jgi:MFS family permease